MEKTELNLIEDPVDLNILSNIDDKKNITDISIATGYTYKSVFHRIKKLEKQGLIKLNKTSDITAGAVLTIPKEVQEKISHQIRRFKFAESELNELQKDKQISKNIIEILNFVSKNRLVCDADVSSFIWIKYYKEGQPETIFKVKRAYDCLIDSGRLRSRVEITRAGKKLLQEHIDK